MKLENGKTVYVGGKKYRGEIPDSIAEKAVVKEKEQPKKKQPEKAVG